MTNVDFLKDRLDKLLNGDDSLVITLDGEWGVGKTTFWKKFVKDNLENKKVSYTSLFGKDTIQDIRTDIILQISKKDEYLNKSKKFFSNIKHSIGLKDDDINFGLTGSMISSFLTLFSKDDFENVIVCIDDFERLSKHLDEKDILGLISELKEQKECKVVMILNQDKVDNETLSKYKDKIIDYELNYLPTPEESYELVKHKLKSFKIYPSSYFIQHNITNIRVMKRVINSLNDFSFVEQLVKGYMSLEKEIAENIIEISTINAIEHFKDFDKLKSYSFEKMSSKYSSHNTEFEENEQYERVLNYITTANTSYFDISKITEYIINYIHTSIINQEPLLNIINEQKSIKNREMIYNEINELRDNFHFNMKYKNADFVKNLYTIFEKNNENIVSILNTINFIFYINLLKELDEINSDKYHNFGIKVLKKQLVKILSKKENLYGFDKDNFTSILEFDESLEIYLKEKEQEEEKQKLNNLKEIIQLMKQPLQNNSWGDEPTLLASLEEKSIRQYILDSPEFVEVLFDFIRKYQKTESFVPYTNKVIKVFEEMKKDEDIDIKTKINKMLTFFKYGSFSSK
ncbi:hypothetical protein ACH5BF_07785 [Arcobacter sp. YIC-464]|uniref:hypothetical protein n=1 Tax=Arcobacter sp. YIC-464 TaxID=3376631 RepID=UPI003C13CB79